MQTVKICVSIDKKLVITNLERRIHMDKIYVIYWSQSGNTQAMAEAVGKGITAGGREAVVRRVEEATAEELRDAKCFALGCPAMGAESLEESEMEPFVGELENFVAGKTLALFGSYGWGGGQWMEDWADRMKESGASILNGAGVICPETPDDKVLLECEELGRALASV